MNGVGGLKSMEPEWYYSIHDARTSTAAPQELTLSPQMLYLQQPTESRFPQRPLDSKPVQSETASSFATASSDYRRRESVSSISSHPRRQKSESPASSPGGSQGSPEPSIGEQISQMSAAPFASGFDDTSWTAFGLGTIAESAHGECLAYGYQYVSVDQLADHQRITHGLSDVII